MAAIDNNESASSEGFLKKDITTKILLQLPIACCIFRFAASTNHGLPCSHIPNSCALISVLALDLLLLALLQNPMLHSLQNRG
ncbi:unnamed protein product [Linum trigynum]|uniref:Uncharacterized protein n=1 Tax=Linum trigynum TaxID=586398 RepID=A0AAV2G936_9ROSI